MTETKTGLGADEQLDALIERRAEQLAEQERVERKEMEAVLRHDLKAQATLRRAWAAHYRHMIRVHESLAADNRHRLEQLIDDSERRSNA